MFDRLVIRRVDTGHGSLDLGRICEALLFYSNVHVILDRSALSSLIQADQLESLFVLLDQGHITASVTPEVLGIVSEPRDGLLRCGYSAFSVTGTADGTKLNRKEQASHIVGAIIKDRWAANRCSKRLFKRAKLIKLTDRVAFGSELQDSIGRALKDEPFRRMLVELALKENNIDVPENFLFDFVAEAPVAVHAFGGANSFLFRIRTDPQSMAVLAESGHLPTMLLSSSLAYAYEAFVETNLAASYGAELATTNLLSEVVAAEIGQTLSKAFPAERQISEFYSAVMPQMGSVREVIATGERSFRDFLTLLNAASRFKEELANKHPDVSLLQGYIERISRESYFDHLPIKALRFLLFGIGGFFGDLLVPGVSVGLGAVDSFVLENLLKGWRPSQFVNTSLKAFVNLD